MKDTVICYQRVRRNIVLILFLLRFVEVLVFHQVLYGLIMFKKKQELKHLLSSVAAITSYEYFGLY